MSRLQIFTLVVVTALQLGVRLANAQVSSPVQSGQSPGNQDGPPASDAARALNFRQLIEQATQDFKASNYDRAIENYSAAYELRRRPPLLFNIAQVYRKAGRIQEALKFYEDFLREDPQSELTPEVQSYVKALRASPQRGGAVTDATATTPPPQDNFLGTEEERRRLFRQHIDSAVAKSKSSDYEGAAGEYWAAYGLKPQKVILFNVGQAYRKAGRWAEAQTLFQRYLREEPGSPLTGEVEAYIAESQARLNKQQIDANRQNAENLARANAALAERLLEIREIERKIVAQKLVLQPKPIYRRPWFWVLIGTATVGAAVGIGLGVGLQPRLPTSDLGKAVLQF